MTQKTKHKKNEAYSDESSDEEADEDEKKDKKKEEDSEDDSPEIGDSSVESYADENEELMHIVPKPYDVQSMWRLDGSYLIVGKRRFGKTTCLQSLLSEIGDFYPSGVYVFSKTKHNKFWSQHVPEERIYPDMDWEVIDQILAEQKKKRKQREQTGQQTEIPYILIILDDMISSRHDMRYVERMLNLFFEGRHYDISIAICAQDIKGIPPDIRQNVDQVFLTYQTQQRQIITIREDYADLGWPSANKVFPRFIRQYTANHQLLIIDQSEAKENVAECFYTYNPDPDPPPFRLGDYAFWNKAGCNWNEQMRIYANVLKTALTGKLDDPKLEVLFKEQWKKSDMMEKLYPNFDAQDFGENYTKISAIGIASDRDQEQYFHEIKAGLYENSATLQTQRAMDFLHNLYQPPPLDLTNK